jgi:hypothetical protein
MLKLKEALLSEVTLFILLPENGSFGTNIAGGRGNSFIVNSLLSVSGLSLSSVVGGGFSCSCCDEFLVATAVDGKLESFKTFDTSDGSTFGGTGCDFLRNRSVHITVIMAMVAAKPAAKNEKWSNGCINVILSRGTLLPMTSNIQFVWDDVVVHQYLCMQFVIFFFVVGKVCEYLFVFKDVGI